MTDSVKGNSLQPILLVCVQMEKEPEKMDAEAVRHTLEALVDTRPTRCRDHAYEFTRLDSTDMTISIIMSYHNAEFYNVKLALAAVAEYTPYDLYSEIILIDDATTDDRIRLAAMSFLHDPKFNKVSVYCVFIIVCDPHRRHIHHHHYRDY